MTTVVLSGVSTAVVDKALASGGALDSASSHEPMLVGGIRI